MPFITRSIIIIYLIWFCSVAWRATAGNDNGKIHIIFFFSFSILHRPIEYVIVCYCTSYVC